MSAKGPKATCLLCDSKYTGPGMTRHLKSCLPNNMKHWAKQHEDKDQSSFHIQVRAVYSPGYWLHLNVNSSTPLRSLDQFLRDIWLECCGHMSAFRYGRNQVGMNRRLKEVLEPDMELLYDYDFGTTTELLIKVLGEYSGPMEKNRPVQILARNEAPEIPCDECGESSAVLICTECQWEGGGWLCQPCAEDHKCDEEVFLPVVNSPRTGECGYTGELEPW